MKWVSTTILMLLVTTQSFAQNPDDIWEPPQKDSLLEILDHAYNLEFDLFDKKMSAYQKKFPNRPESIFGGVMPYWIKMTADQSDTKLAEQFMAKLDTVIEKLEDYDDDDPLYKVAEFYLNSAIGFRAILHVMNQSWFAAALAGRSAIGGIEDALEGKVPNPDAKFGTGLYLYYADIIPKRMPLLKPLFIFYPNGDKKRGLADLKESTEKGIFSKVVSAYMYAVILHTREHKYREALSIMQSLSERYPKNPSFIIWHASIASRLAKYDLAEELLKTVAQRIKNKEPYYPEYQMRMVNFRIGEIYFRKGRYHDALNILNEAVEPLEEPMETRYERYKVYATLNIGYCQQKLGRPEEAIATFERVLKMKDFRKSHENAEKQIRQINKSQKKAGLN